MMVREYLNQTATLKTVIGLSGYGKPITEDKEIPCRFEMKRKLVRDRQGNEVVSEVTMYCIESVKPEDRVVYNGQEYTVISVLEVVDLDGNIVYYEVAL